MLLALAAAAALAPAPVPPGSDAVREWRLAHERAIVRELADLVSLPNLAKDAPAIRGNAEAIRAMLSRRGIASRLLEVEGAPPAVLGERRTPGARRTVVFYAHYDGQPVRPATWHSDPWRPVLRDGRLEDGAREIALAGSGPLPAEARLFGRSVSDDKAPIVAMMAALDALAATGGAPDVDLKFFFEGEEEAGSPHLAAFLDRYRDLLAADLWLLCDGPVHASRRMQVYFGARGITEVEMTLYGPARPLHSGHYGNWAPNPAVELAHLVAALRDTDGRVLVPRFYDDVKPPTPAERQALAEVPDVDGALREELALGRTEAGGARLVERILLPALNVRGLSSGAVGAEAANAIPVDARASIDLRLVPDQTPEGVRAQVEAHLTSLGYEIVHAAPTVEQRRAAPRLVRLDWGPGYPAARVAMDTEAARAVVRAVEEAVGGPVIRLPTLGGSVGMETFTRILGAPVVGVPIVNHDNNQHGADENLRLANLWQGIEVFAALMGRLESDWPSGPARDP